MLCAQRPGTIASEKTWVAMLEAMGVDTGIDLAARMPGRAVEELLGVRTRGRFLHTRTRRDVLRDAAVH